MRTLLIERAAQMLRAREPITLRSLVAGTGVSTMAVYTYFGSMDGLWKALRQEGFTRLAAKFAPVPASDDPVADLAGLIAAYLGNALEHPDLYRVMFDASFDLEDLKAADATLELLVQAARRGQEAGRFRAASCRWTWRSGAGPSATGWSPSSPTALCRPRRWTTLRSC